MLTTEKEIIDDIDRRVQERDRERDAQFQVSEDDYREFVLHSRTRLQEADEPADEMSDADVIRWALQPFCVGHESRYQLTDPFILRPNDGASYLNNWIYATNSRIAVRLGIQPVRRWFLREWDQAAGRRPSASDIFAWPKQSFQETPTVLWPASELLQHEMVCLRCDGKGGLGEECRRCSGSGCRYCHESGNQAPYCLTCKGAGGHVYPSLRPVGQYYVWICLEQKILSLPNVRLIPPLGRIVDDNGHYSADPIQFIFTGGQGLVMPVDLTRARSYMNG